MFDPIHMNLAEYATTPFQSQEEMIAAMSNPQYRNPANDAYRRAVEMKMALDVGTLGVSVRAYNDTTRSDESVPVENQRTEQEQYAIDMADAEQALQAQYGALSVRPDARASTGQPEARYEIEGTQRASISTL
jgi:hypothetical protein